MTMSKVLEKFWIQKLRSMVKKIVHNCNVCKRFRVKPLSAPTKSMLPEFRAELKDPFLVTGVDFAGPIRYRMAKRKVEWHTLNPDAPEFNPRKAQVEEEREPRPGRRAKRIARDQIKSVTVHEDEEA